MRIPPDAEIPQQKLTRYLLVPRTADDKSKFLAQAGFGSENADELRSAIRAMASSLDAVEDGDNEYGTFYRVDGKLAGTGGRILPVSLIWIEWKVDGSFHFVTLKPLRLQS